MHRLSLLGNQFEPALENQLTTATAAPAQAAPGGKKDSLSVVDNRTGKLHAFLIDTF